MSQHIERTATWTRNTSIMDTEKRSDVGVRGQRGRIESSDRGYYRQDRDKQRNGRYRHSNMFLQSSISDSSLDSKTSFSSEVKPTERPTSPTTPPPLETFDENEPVKVIEKWDGFDLKENLLRGIYSHGLEEPSQIQKTGILPIKQKRDLIAQAPSGTGKTATFSIGALERVDLSSATTQILILAPTHELVKQIATVIQSIGSMMDELVIKTILGGTPIMEDAISMRNNVPHIIVGTVGRTLDMIHRRHIQSKNIKLLVMDEADEMLSRGFKDQIYHIFQSLNPRVQVALFSATIPDEVLSLSKSFMNCPVKITIKAEQLNLDGIQQFFVALPDDNAKFSALKDLFTALSVKQCIIYANSIDRVVDLCHAMNKEGFSVCSIHSSMTPDERDRAISEFRKGSYRVLISSNVTSRGIDIQQVSTVINFDIPRCVHNYLHRIGRSGRWGRKGLAINFITKEDVTMMRHITQHYKSDIKELPMNYADYM